MDGSPDLEWQERRSCGGQLCLHVNIVLLHAKSARGGQLSEVGVPLGHHETAVQTTEKVKTNERYINTGYENPKRIKCSQQT